MHDDPLIQAEELAGRLGDPSIRIFDCRFDLARPDDGRRRYEDEHLPGAVYADLNRDLSALQTPTSGRHPLPSPADFESRLRAWGVNRDSLVIVYDDANAMFAARFWWMARWLGHAQVRVLDGGLRRWMQLGLPLDDSVPAQEPGNFTAHPLLGMAVDATGVFEATRDASFRVLDARAPERYRGDVEPIDPVAGHVPGARNHPFTLSLAADGRFLPATELRESFDARLEGVTAERSIVMCGSGVTACHVLLAMERAGLAGGRLYAGSWSEWSSDPSRPVARGEEP